MEDLDIFLKHDGTIIGELSCPGCRQSYGLHHGEIEIFSRNEDDDHGLHVTVVTADPYLQTKGAVSIDESMANNPSLRRSGLIISFYCENCDGLTARLTLSQHKGSSLINYQKFGKQLK